MGWIFFGKKISPWDYDLLEETLDRWPESFRAKPTGIKLGRAIFVPIILLFSLFRYAPSDKQ